jgi:hypothetical protein
VRVFDTAEAAAIEDAAGIPQPESMLTSTSSPRSE